MATKAQIAAAAAAQKAFNAQLAKTQAAASQTAATVANLTSSQTPELTSAEERLFGVYVNPAGQIVPGTRPAPTPTVTPISTPAADVGTRVQVSPFQKALDDLLAGTLKDYGIVGIADTIARIRADYPEASSDQILLLLKNDTRYNANYNTRFSGNAMRKAAGLPTLDDATYLKSEKEYEKVMKAYGLDKTTLATQKMYGTFIGNMMDLADVTGRISLVFDNLKASPEIERSFRQFYPMLNKSDIVAAFLNPEEQLPALKNKVQAAEIGGAALMQGLETNLTDLVTTTETGYSNVTGGTIGAETIRAGGTTSAAAKTAYAKIAEELPTAEKLSSIYAKQGLAQYGQREAEKARIQGLASEKRKQEELIKAEEASFLAKSGTTKVSFQKPRTGF
jgi:hypothetical protein